MRDLARLQRELAEVIRTGDAPSEDAYLAEVAQSTGLDVLRDCIAEWRELVLRRACPLTVALLQSRGELTAAVRRLLRKECPPFHRELALAFLDDVSADADAHLQQTAAYEAAMIRRYAS